MAALGLAVLAVLLVHVPAFYRGQPFPSPAALSADTVAGPEQQRLEQLARRMVTKASSLHAAIGQAGPWGEAFTAAEVNAWLAVDLPRNHRSLLPRGVAEPRLQFSPRHVAAGARVGSAALSAVAWVELEMQLREENQLGIVLTEASLGAIPLPRGPVLRALAHRLGGLGLMTDVRRLDGRMVLVVHIPSTHEAGVKSHWLESLSLDDGEMILAGTTRSGSAVAGR